MGGVRSATAALVVGVSLLVVPSAGATITLGSSLTAPVDSGIGGDITAFPIRPPAGSCSEEATTPSCPALTYSRVTGTVIGGNVKQDTSVTPGWGTASLRVMHNYSTHIDFEYGVVGAGPPNVIPSGTGIFPLAAHVGISRGDIVAIQATGSLNRAISSGAAYWWGNTSTFPPGAVSWDLRAGFPDSELLYNVQIEPANTFFLGPPTGGKSGSASVLVNVPNPGTIDAGAINDAGLAAAAKKKRTRKPLLTRISGTRVDEGQVTLPLTASPAGRKVLRAKGKLKTTLKVVYTPTGGSSTTKTVPLKLKM